MSTYRTATGQRTDRVPVELEPNEAAALTDLAEFLRGSRGDGGPDDSLLRGLERVAKAWKAEGK
jgi:hypothetical protein